MRYSISKICNIAIAFFAFSSNVFSQQVFKVSQFVQHNYIYNPAATGANEESSLGVATRKMWSGIAGGPQTNIVFGDTYFSKMKTGLGVVLYSDKTGPTSRTGGQINLSYSINFKDDKRLMFGLQGIFMQYRIDKGSFAHYIPNDPLLLSSSNEMKGDAGAGIYYKSNTLNVGFSVQQLMQSKLNFLKTSSNSEGKLYRHYFAGGHYNIRTDEDDVLVPNFMVNFVPNLPADVEVGMRLEHKDLLFLGLNYHYRQGFGAYAGIKAYKKYSFGYNLSVYRTPLGIFEDGGQSHEFSLRYFFKK